jgi:purine-binding chemotaxis protein CheW
MSTSSRFLVLRVDDRRFALPLAVISRVIQAVAVTPLPGAPGLVLGAVNVHGEIVPVLDVRQRFQCPPREIRASDSFALAYTSRRMVALAIDQPEGVVERPDDAIVSTSAIVPNVDAFPAIARLEDGLMLIHDLDRFLSAGDADALDEALDAAQRP